MFEDMKEKFPEYVAAQATLYESLIDWANSSKDVFTGFLDTTPGSDVWPLFGAIDRMNRMYELPVNLTPTNLGEEALQKYFRTFEKEWEERNDVLESFRTKESIDAMVDLADWMADKIVYIISECAKWGIPIDQVLVAVQISNFTKLGEDGKPIKDENGKFIKGPNYQKPEPLIKYILQQGISDKKETK